MSVLSTKMNSSSDSSCTDCDPFLIWDQEDLESVQEREIVYRSLVATLKVQPALDVSLEAKAVKLLESLLSFEKTSANAFLNTLSSNSDDSVTTFVQSFVVLISSTSQVITTASMKMLENLFLKCSTNFRLTLVKADLIPQLITTLNPLSLSFAEAEVIHTCLIRVISSSFWLLTSNGLAHLKIEVHVEEQAVHETILKQVLFPSENYIWHLYENRFSIVDGEQSECFLALLAQLFRISPYYQPTMELVRTIPVFLTIPSCYTYFENDRAIWYLLYFMVEIQQEWKKQSKYIRRSGATIFRSLRMEGIEDAIEEKLRNDKPVAFRPWIAFSSIKWNSLLDMNIPKQE
ncbi:hypothetical protein BLNAU_13698 [Blattamonas nauphoetae]|uniref:Uncharacterized protein n=1 Tax=Blattamonas nauphoetae TaxID=2049346 RepID=A0ABQ9XHY7_9EUKA|nr:hypothetical protein BLNAU_13698 [Blattamonas nauphoetae]